MVIDDHGLEVIRKAGRYLEPDNKKDNYALQVWQVNDPTGGGSVTTSPNINTLNLVNNGQEYSFNLPVNCKGFRFKARTLCRLKFNYQSITGDDYYSIPIGGGFSDTNFYTNRTVFFIADRDNITLEILTFT